MYGATGRDSPLYASLAESGAKWVRVPIDWRMVEPVDVEPPQYDWRHADAAIGAARDGCYHMIVTHGGDPAWAEGTSTPVDPAAFNELAEYLGVLVERYDGDGDADAPGSPRVRHWEIYNEPDDTLPLDGARWGYAGAAYAQLLATVYPAIKTADPAAQVLFGGVAHDWYKEQRTLYFMGFIDDVLAAGGGAYFDVMTFHTYPPYAGNWAMQGPGLYEKTLYIRDKLARYELDKPIMITETAHHSNPAWPELAGSDEMQMRYIVQLYTQAVAADVDVTIWFALADPGGDYPFDSGLITGQTPPQPKAALAVFATVATQLDGLRAERRLTAAETGASDMEAYHFVRSTTGETVIVAWLDPVESDVTAELTVAAEETTVRDMWGQAVLVVDLADGMDDGSVTVPVSGRPIYIEVGP
jgi:hypothetical protein